MAWDKNSKPPANICPEDYCFHWVPASGIAQMSRRLYPSLEEALADKEGWKSSLNGECCVTFGRCKRKDPAGGDRDWYEPCEPVLERDGLPWFYFVLSAENLVPELREEYIRESRRLWGNK